jgi:hypothetical protein
MSVEKANNCARLKLPHGETNPTKLYSFPDPDANLEAWKAVNSWRYWNGPLPTPGQVSAVLDLAYGYLDLTTYELGQECCVRKLRDIWRARRARKANGDG